MKECPILMNAAMVRATLAGTKTQTRRITKPQPDIVANKGPLAAIYTPEDERLGRLGKVLPCPYGQPGDQLWVRETSRAEELPSGLDGVRYTADDAFVAIENTREASEQWCAMHSYRGQRGAIVPSIHMPRWASRINLEIVSVRVERLNDIREEDAKAEGANQYLLPVHPSREQLRHVDGFAQLWESINGTGSWAANPWVWCISFRKL